MHGQYLKGDIGTVAGSEKMGEKMRKPIEANLNSNAQSHKCCEELTGHTQKNKQLIAEFASLDSTDPEFVTHLVDRILAAAQDYSASDVHLQPFANGLEVLFRIDGVLQPIATFASEIAPNIVARLKVRSELLTYRTDIPQEGRIRAETSTSTNSNEASSSNRPDVEMRVSTFPTLHGERAVVRLFAGSDRFRQIEDLGLPADIAVGLADLLEKPAGAILATGPAGSGKTTTIYACLRELADNCKDSSERNKIRRNIVSLEDPVEVAIDGVSQSQIGERADLDLATALRFLMRQDPEVIMVGEIRDPETAEAALRASLTGHLLLTTFHAGSAAEAVGRLLDMGIEPYLLRSGLLAILSQRLARRLCRCHRTVSEAVDTLGVSLEEVSVPVGCEACHQTGFRERFVLAEMLVPDRTEVGSAIISRLEATEIERLAVAAGMITQWQRGVEAVAAGLTSVCEIRRVLGVSRCTNIHDEG
ncbi:MAG: type II/IV secretion system protein [Pirellulales bacterium]|nr:type II/IV secretion system protein [Pirellulales bacterium]